MNPFIRQPFRVDLRIDLPGGEGAFVVEADGEGHYDCDEKKALRPIPEQLARDRYKENWCLEHGLSVFRVPYTFMWKPERAVAYVLAAARADRAAGLSRVHFLDFERTYARINRYALEQEDVALLLVRAGPGGVGVGRREVPLGCSA
jgi:very-short-patch-repair endonuclease